MDCHSLETAYFIRQPGELPALRSGSAVVTDGLHNQPLHPPAASSTMRIIRIKAKRLSSMAVGHQAKEECGALYAEHHRWLLGWLHDAADLAQDTFIRVLTARDAASVEPIHEPRAFLRTVAGRLLSNHLRRRSLELAWQQTLASLPARGGCSCSPNPKD